MYLQKLHAFTRQSLRGHYAAASRAALLCPGLRLGMRAIPVLLAGVCISAGGLAPLALFRQPGWCLLTLFWGMTGFAVLLPVRCGVWSWFCDRLGLGHRVHFFFRDAGAYLRAFCFFGTAALLRWLALLPAASAAVFAAYAFRHGAMQEEGGLWLFAAVQGMAAAVWCLWAWLRFCLSMTALPVLYLAAPEEGIFSAIRRSQKMLRGHYCRLAGVLLRYLPAMLPVVTIPFVLPYLYADVILFLHLRMLEHASEVPGKV